MPTTITTENPGKDVLRYVKHWTNPRYVDEALLGRHTGLSKEQRRRKARTAALSILQGLEFLEGAAGASPLTRPLPLFYAVENFVKGLALINDPSLEGSDFRAHGLRGDKSKRYSVKNFICKVQPPGSDVWSRAHRLLNADWVKLAVVTDGQSVTRSWRRRCDAPSPLGRDIRFGELVRQLPEMARDVVIAGWGHPYVVHVPQFDYRSTTNPPSASVRMLFRHAHNADTRAMIVRHERDLLAGYTRGVDTLDVIEYSMASATSSSIPAPNPRCDTFGEFFMTFVRSRDDLSELLIYLASLFILSDVVRYQVDQWARLLDDHPDEAILIERFLDLAARKVPNLVLSELEGEYFQFKVGA